MDSVNHLPGSALPVQGWLKKHTVYAVVGVAGVVAAVALAVFSHIAMAALAAVIGGSALLLSWRTDQHRPPQTSPNSLPERSLSAARLAAVAPTGSVSSTSVPASSVQAMPSPRALKEFARQMWWNYPSQSERMSFKDAQGTEYYCWVGKSNSINIQTKWNFNRASPILQQQNKIGLMINRDGVITSVYVNGQPSQRGIPPECSPWIATAVSTCAANHASASQNYSSPDLFQPNKLKSCFEYLNVHHSQQSEKVSFKDADGEEYYCWVGVANSINIQKKANFDNIWPDVLRNKIGLKVQEDGSIASIYVDSIPCSGIPMPRCKWISALISAVESKTAAHPADVDGIVHPFKSDELNRLKNLLIAAGFTASNRMSYNPCDVWCDSTANGNVVHIEGTPSHLQLHINHSGVLTSFKVDGRDLNGHAEIGPHKQPVEDALTAILGKHCRFKERSSDTTLHIELVQKGIDRVLNFILIETANWLTRKTPIDPNPRLKVTYLQDDLRPQAGIDAGALSRSLFDDLFEGLTEGKGAFPLFKKVGEYTLPYHSAIDPDNPEKVPALSKEQQQAYEAIGRLIMYCFHSESSGGPYNNQMVTGQHFDIRFFQILFLYFSAYLDADLSSDQGFQERYMLSINTLSILGQKPLIRLLDKEEHDLADSEIAQAILLTSPDDGVDYYSPEGDEILYNDYVSVKKGRANWFSIQKQLHNHIVHDEYGMRISMPFQAIAQGMRKACLPGSVSTGASRDQRWNEIRASDPRAFSKKVQGELNRQAIVDSIELEPIANATHRLEIVKKVGWLKEWITSVATEQELRAFLKFLSGSKALPKGAKIKIQLPIPTATYLPIKVHACGCQIELSPVPTHMGDLSDETKDKFFQCIGIAIRSETDFGAI